MYYNNDDLVQFSRVTVTAKFVTNSLNSSLNIYTNISEYLYGKGKWLWLGSYNFKIGEF